MGLDRLYLETSVWNFLFADDSPDKMALTAEFFAAVEAGRWSPSISAIVLDEILATREEGHRDQLLAAIRRVGPLELEVTAEVLELANKYLLQGTMPARFMADAIHVAVAVVAAQDVVVSWNMRHLVKVKTRREVNAVNLLNGYRTIEIATPEEMV